MIYAEYTDFVALYGNDVPQTDFNRLAYDASALVDYHTTTVDGVKKLKYFFHVIFNTALIFTDKCT